MSELILCLLIQLFDLHVSWFRLAHSNRTVVGPRQQPWRPNSPISPNNSFAPTTPTPPTSHSTPWQTTSDHAQPTATPSSATPGAHPAKAAIEAAHPPSAAATAHAVRKSVAPDATTGTARDRRSEKTNATVELGEEEDEDVVTTADGAATTGEEVEVDETSAPTSATAHPNRPKAREVTTRLLLAAPDLLQPVPGPPPSTPLRRKKKPHPMSR